VQVYFFFLEPSIGSCAYAIGFKERPPRLRGVAKDHQARNEATGSPLHRGSCVYRIAFGQRAGQKALTLRGALPREASGKQKLCANSQGFSLHAAVS
jgi:hypothetical protein